MRELGLVGRSQLQQETSYEQGEFASHWAVLARSEAALGALAADKRWDPLRPGGGRVWTDDFSNIWSVIYWRQ